MEFFNNFFNFWKNLFTMVQNINMKAELIIAKLPVSHVHFCYIHCDQSIECNIRDIDIQIVFQILQQFKSILRVIKRDFFNYRGK